jgi:hypothetical protein
MNKAPVILVADVSPEVIQNRFHDRSSLWLNHLAQAPARRQLALNLSTIVRDQWIFEVHFRDLTQEAAMFKSLEMSGLLVAAAVIGSVVLGPEAYMVFASGHMNYAGIGDYAIDTVLLASFAIPFSLLAVRPSPIRPGWQAIVHRAR